MIVLSLSIELKHVCHYAWMKRDIKSIIVKLTKSEFFTGRSWLMLNLWCAEHLVSFW